jgi:hypothetical protein
MSHIPRVFSGLWMMVLLGAGGFLIWTNHVRLQRIDYVSGLVGGATQTVDVRSPTGFADSQRELIISGRNERSFDWIAQTEQMFAERTARVRHVNYDNAPQGRAVNATSPYRWWLGGMAWMNRMSSGRPIGLSVERAARWADPVWHGFMLVAGTLFVAWQFGGLAAALFAVGLVAFFPFAGGFLPAMPDDLGLRQSVVWASVLVLLAGINALRISATLQSDARIRAARSARRWFIGAGVIGGLGMWVSVSVQIPIMAGVFLGVLLAAALVKSSASGGALVEAWVTAPWRVWGLSGGVTILLAYLLEYFPADLGAWRLDSIHPLYGLAWIGAGELLSRLVVLIQRGKPAWKIRDGVAVVLAFAAVASVPVVMWKTGSQGFLARDVTWARLTGLHDGIAAANFWSWLSRDGATAVVWATLMPLLGLIPATWMLVRSATPLFIRIALAVAVGPVLVALGFACGQLGWWSVLDGGLLGLVVVATASFGAGVSRGHCWFWSGLVAIVAAAGIAQLLPPTFIGPGTTLPSRESEELIERHLAHWLNKRAGEPGVVVYAPPQETSALCFYGGLRGLGTFAAENQTGLGTSLMIAGVKTMEEVQGLLLAHGVRYIIVPSWDPFFDEFAQRYLDKSYANRTSLLIRELRRWNLPPWLRALPYQIPVGGGFEGQSVLVFEVVDEQNPAVAASRLAEYLVEIGQLDAAKVAGETLRRFPGNVGAMVALAQVQAAREDSAAFAQTLAALQARVASNADRFLPWDRRVSLAVVLARGNQDELAREQMKRCVAEADAKKLRSLTTGSLYGFEVLAKAFDLKPADAALGDLARSLLPPDLRERL